MFDPYVVVVTPNTFVVVVNRQDIPNIAGTISEYCHRTDIYKKVEARRHFELNSADIEFEKKILDVLATLDLPFIDPLVRVAPDSNPATNSPALP